MQDTYCSTILLNTCPPLPISSFFIKFGNAFFFFCNFLGIFFYFTLTYTHFDLHVPMHGKGLGKLRCFKHSLTKMLHHLQELRNVNFLNVYLCTSACIGEDNCQVISCCTRLSNRSPGSMATHKKVANINVFFFNFSRGFCDGHIFQKKKKNVYPLTSPCNDCTISDSESVSRGQASIILLFIIHIT